MPRILIGWRADRAICYGDSWNMYHAGKSCFATHSTQLKLRLWGVQHEKDSTTAVDHINQKRQAAKADFPFSNKFPGRIGLAYREMLQWALLSVTRQLEVSVLISDLMLGRIAFNCTIKREVAKNGIARSQSMVVATKWWATWAMRFDFVVYQHDVLES